MIEILVAITIFAIGMLAVASMQISGIQGNATANIVTGASNWASDKVEELIARPYDHTSLNHGTTYGPFTEGRYTIQYTVTEHAPINNVKTIEVTVSWTDRGESRQMVFNYYRAKI